MKSTTVALWTCLTLLASAYIGACSESPAKPLDPEPIYKGKRLSYWAGMTQDQSPDFSPSPEAVEAIEAVRAIGTNGIPFLIQWLQPPWADSTIPGGITESFRALGTEAKSAIPILTSFLNKPLTTNSPSVYAAEALSYLGPSAIPKLLMAATNFHGEQHLQSEIIRFIGNFGTNGGSAIPALIGWAHDTNAWVRLQAVNSLAQIGLEPNIVVPVLHAALNDPDWLVRRDAAEALGVFGKDARDSVPDLIQTLKSAEWGVQVGAIGGLGRMGEQREVVLPLLAKKLSDKNAVIRRCAAFALGDLGGKEAFQALMSATDDPDGFVRQAVFQSLKQIDPEALAKSGKKNFRSSIRRSF